MVRTSIVAAIVLGLTAPAMAVELPRPTPHPQQINDDATKGVGAETPPALRDALEGVRRLHQYQGRNGLDATATARERAPGIPEDDD